MAYTAHNPNLGSEPSEDLARGLPGVYFGAPGTEQLGLHRSFGRPPEVVRTQLPPLAEEQELVANDLPLAANNLPADEVKHLSKTDIAPQAQSTPARANFSTVAAQLASMLSTRHHADQRGQATDAGAQSNAGPTAARYGLGGASAVAEGRGDGRRTAQARPDQPAASRATPSTSSTPNSSKGTMDATGTRADSFASQLKGAVSASARSSTSSSAPTRPGQGLHYSWIPGGEPTSYRELNLPARGRSRQTPSARGVQCEADSQIPVQDSTHQPEIDPPYWGENGGPSVGTRPLLRMMLGFPERAPAPAKADATVQNDDKSQPQASVAEPPANGFTPAFNAMIVEGLAPSLYDMIDTLVYDALPAAEAREEAWQARQAAAKLELQRTPEAAETVVATEPARVASSGVHVFRRRIEDAMTSARQAVHAYPNTQAERDDLLRFSFDEEVRMGAESRLRRHKEAPLPLGAYDLADLARRGLTAAVAAYHSLHPENERSKAVPLPDPVTVLANFDTLKNTKILELNRLWAELAAARKENFSQGHHDKAYAIDRDMARLGLTTTRGVIHAAERAALAQLRTQHRPEDLAEAGL